MMRLFPASQRAHATYILDKSTHQRRDRDGKLEVHYKTVRKSVTLDQWRRHLAEISARLAWPATTTARAA